MKRSTQLWKSAMVATLMSLLYAAALAQSEAQAGDALRLEHKGDSTLSATVQIDQPMRVWTSDRKKYTARLKEVKDSSFVIGTQEIPMASVVKLRAYSKPLGVKKVKTWARRSVWPIGVGLLVLIVGLLVASAVSLSIGVLLALLGSLTAFIGVAILFFSFVVLLNDNTPATTFRRAKYWLVNAKKSR
jgi:hypothetical protein